MPDQIVEMMPPLSSLYVYGPLGIFFAIALIIGLHYYFFVRAPYAKKKNELELECYDANKEYTKTAKEVIERLANSSERNGDRLEFISKRQEEHSDILHDHSRKLDVISVTIAAISKGDEA